MADKKRLRKAIDNIHKLQERWGKVNDPHGSVAQFAKRQQESLGPFLKHMKRQQELLEPFREQMKLAQKIDPLGFLYEDDSEEEEITNAALEPAPSDSKSQKKKNRRYVYSIEFSFEDSIIFLKSQEGLRKIKRLNLKFNSGKIFSYVYRHPKKVILREDLEKKFKKIPPFRYLIHNWGFRGTLKKVFFQIHKDQELLFHQRVTFKYLQKIFAKFQIPPTKL